VTNGEAANGPEEARQRGGSVTMSGGNAHVTEGRHMELVVGGAGEGEAEEGGAGAGLLGGMRGDCCCERRFDGGCGRGVIASCSAKQRNGYLLNYVKKGRAKFYAF
jgi:hypothetical protein